ncbi:MAG: family 10 glycosylhydrolase [Leptolyngbya sp. SIO4C1]|nr:family 10 glycosylhydrolase [Leptolyngbya sp. SIO4C1]
MAKAVRKRRLRHWVLFLGAIWLVFALWQAPVVPPAAAEQIRGVWMTNVGASLMYYTLRADEVVANLAKHHLNTLYPCVWNRGYTLHPSRTAKAAGAPLRDVTTDMLFVPGDDILRELVYQAHRQHLRILPWFEYGLMIPATAAIAQAHPDWLTVNQAGATVGDPLAPNPILPRPLRNFQLEIAGGNLAWLNPFHPEVQQFLTDLIVEVVQRYAVDGIQLDDHFGLPIDFGYDPYTVNRYQSEHGGAAPPSDPSDAEWVAWRANQITQLMEKITYAVKAVDPKAAISISPNPPSFAYRKYLQDWTRWVDLGLIDEVVVQLYRTDLSIFENDLYNSGFYQLRDRVPIAIGLYTGPFLSSKPIDRLSQEIQAVQAAGYRGVAFFCWETTFWFFKGSSAQEIWQTLVNQFAPSSSLLK